MLIMYTGFFRLGVIRILIDNAYTHGAKMYYVQKYKREKGKEILAHLKHTHVDKQSAYHMVSLRFRRFALAIQVSENGTGGT